MLEYEQARDHISKFCRTNMQELNIVAVQQNIKRN
jgi:hypothetical protein